MQIFAPWDNKHKQAHTSASARNVPVNNFDLNGNWMGNVSRNRSESWQQTIYIDIAHVDRISTRGASQGASTVAESCEKYKLIHR